MSPTQEEVYVQQPPGYVAEGESSKVCYLCKSLYGLKQSPHVWFEKLTTILLEFGFVRCKSDYFVFVKKNQRGCAILIVYVNHMVISGSDGEGIHKTKDRLKSSLHIKDLGQLRYFLGIEVLRDEHGIYLSQKNYIVDLLKETGTLHAKSLPLENLHQASTK